MGAYIIRSNAIISFVLKLANGETPESRNGESDIDADELYDEDEIVKREEVVFRINPRLITRPQPDRGFDGSRNTIPTRDPTRALTRITHERGYQMSSSRRRITEKKGRLNTVSVSETVSRRNLGKKRQITTYASNGTSMLLLLLVYPKCAFYSEETLLGYDTYEYLKRTLKRFKEPRSQILGQLGSIPETYLPQCPLHTTSRIETILFL